MDDILVAEETCPFTRRFTGLIPGNSQWVRICYSVLEQDIEFHPVQRAPLLAEHVRFNLSNTEFDYMDTEC